MEEQGDGAAVDSAGGEEEGRMGGGWVMRAWLS